MATTINSNTTDGLVITPDTSGEINLQANGSTIATVNSTGITMTSGKGISNFPSSSLPTGSVLQVKHSHTQNVISTTSTTYTATGHSIAITPLSSSSKFLIMVSGGLFWNDTDSKEAFTEIFRDIGGGGYSRISPYSNPSPMDISGTYGATIRNSHSICWLDSPNTTSEVTYQPYFRTNSGGTAYYNLASVVAQLTVMEIAG